MLVLTPCLALTAIALIARNNVFPCTKCPEGFSGWYVNNDTVCERFHRCELELSNPCILSNNVSGVDYCKASPPQLVRAG